MASVKKQGCREQGRGNEPSRHEGHGQSRRQPQLRSHDRSTGERRRATKSSSLDPLPNPLCCCVSRALSLFPVSLAGSEGRHRDIRSLGSRSGEREEARAAAPAAAAVSASSEKCATTHPIDHSSALNGLLFLERCCTTGEGTSKDGRRCCRTSLPLQVSFCCEFPRPSLQPSSNEFISFPISLANSHPRVIKRGFRAPLGPMLSSGAARES